MVGNFATVIVMSSLNYHTPHSCRTYLVVITLMEIGHVASTTYDTWNIMVQEQHLYHVKKAETESFSECLIMYSVEMFFQSLTLCLVCVITTERYKVIHQPMSAITDTTNKYKVRLEVHYKLAVTTNLDLNSG